MDNKCPKCAEKLSVLDLKTTCPKCGCDLIKYNESERLEKDAEKAEAEWTWAQAKLAPLKRLWEKIKSIFKRKKKEDDYHEIV